MVDSFNIPQDLTKLFEIKDTSAVLRKFLIDLALKVDMLEKTNKTLEARLKAAGIP